MADGRGQHCESCQEAHVRAKPPKPTPCEGCEAAAPLLWPENKTAWALWRAVCSQWRAVGVFDRVIRIGLDYPAVYQTAEILGIDLIPAVLMKIKALEEYEVDRNNPQKHG